MCHCCGQEYEETLPAKGIRDEDTGSAKIPGMLLQYEDSRMVRPGKEEPAPWRAGHSGHIETVVTAVNIHTALLPPYQYF